MKFEYEAVVECYWEGEAKDSEVCVLVPLFPPEMQRGLFWYWTRADAFKSCCVKGQALPWSLKMGPLRSPETSVLNQPTLRNVPEDEIIQVNRSESLRFPIVAVCCQKDTKHKIQRVGGLLDIWMLDAVRLS
jgi:hypothetical protein